MVRCDLAFLLCCCKACLGSSKNDQGESFYDLLGVESDASADDIKRAYKRQSLQMHPDKLAQRGQQATEVDKARFTRMKEAYEVLSDPHKRETYDAMGERGMKWIDEPFSLDPQEIAHNFATSSTVDRSKIFAIFVAIAVCIFILPILICLEVDGVFGPDAKWMAILTPLWIGNVVILFYHTRVIMMGPIPKPDHVTEDEWIDPLPMSKRVFSLVRFILMFVFEILVGLRLDGVIAWDWAHMLAPFYIWEATTLYKKLPLAGMRIVTVEDLETAIGKPFTEFTQAEKELISRRYSVVPSTTSPEFEAAHKLKSRARQDIIKLGFRVVFVVFLILQLDGEVSWNWWLVFAPFWIMSFCICCGSFQSFVEVQAAAAGRDPDYFGGKREHDEEENQTLNSEYGAMGGNGDGLFSSTTPAKNTNNEEKKEPLSEAEREELKAQVFQSGSKFLSSFCSQAFILILVCLFVGKVQGAGYSSIWIISPLLFIAAIILSLLGCMIFCTSGVEDDIADFDFAIGGMNQAQSGAVGNSNYVPPNRPSSLETSGRESSAQSTEPTEPLPPVSLWDPDKGEVWVDPSRAILSSDTAILPHTPDPAPTDLLDNEMKKSEFDSPSVGPTKSEVEDLD